MKLCNSPRLWAEKPAPRCDRPTGHEGQHHALTATGPVWFGRERAVTA